MIDDDPPTTKDKPEQTGAEDAWNAEGWREAAREYHQQRGNRCVVVDIEPARRARLRKLMGDNVSIERAWSEINQRDHVPASTLRAAEYLIAQGDVEQFRKWLAGHSAQERTEIQKYLEAKRCR